MIWCVTKYQALRLKGWSGSWLTRTTVTLGKTNDYDSEVRNELQMSKWLWCWRRIGRTSVFQLVYRQVCLKHT